MYNERRHNTIRANPADAATGVDPTYVETRQQIAKAAQKAYGGLEVDRRQPAFSSRSNRVLNVKVGDLIRTLIIKNGPGLSTWNAAKSNKVSAGNNWSDDVFIVVRVHAARTMGNSTYTLAGRDDNGQPGRHWEEGRVGSTMIGHVSSSNIPPRRPLNKSQSRQSRRRRNQLLMMAVVTPIISLITLLRRTRARK